MTKEEKIQFVMEVFNQAANKQYSDELDEIEFLDYQWLNRFLKDLSFENSLNLDSNLEGAYEAAININKVLINSW